MDHMLIAAWFAAGVLLVGLAHGDELYEEDLIASIPIREEQWRQLEAYVTALGKAAETRDLYPADFSSPEAYLRTIEPLRARLRSVIGYPPPGLYDAVTARLNKVGEDALAEYYRCFVPISEQLETYGLYLVPRGLTGPAPLVIAMHGGGGTPETATFHGGANYHDMVRGAVAQGYVVFAPHHIFNAFSDQDADCKIPANVRALLDQRLRILGTSLTAVEVGKITKALDALLTRPEVNPDRVAMVGLSYGGYYTLHTVAVELRIRCAVSSCFFNDESGRMPLDNPFAWHDMRFQGTLSELADPELVALACPRPLRVQVGTADELFPVEGARRAALRARQYYERLGLGDRFDYAEFEGGHEFRGDIAWEFLKKWL